MEEEYTLVAGGNDEGGGCSSCFVGDDEFKSIAAGDMVSI